MLPLLAALGSGSGCAAHVTAPTTDGGGDVSNSVTDAADAHDVSPPFDAPIDSPTPIAFDASGDPLALPDWYPLTQVACDRDADAPIDAVDGCGSLRPLPAQPLQVPCPDPPFPVACRWEPGRAIGLGLQGAIVDSVVSASDGLYFGNRKEVSDGQFAYFVHLGYEGTLFSAPQVWTCGCTGPVINVALGHGVLIQDFDDGDLALTDSGWSELQFSGSLSPFDCQGTGTSMMLNGPRIEGSPLRAVFTDHTFLFLSGWMPLTLRRLAEDGTPVAAPVSMTVDDTPPSGWAMLAIGQVVLIAWPALLGGVHGLYVTADGDVLVPEFTIPGPAVAPSAALVAHLLGLYSAHGEALITYTANTMTSLSSRTILQTIAFDGTPLGDFVEVPYAGGLQVARTPSGEILIEQQAAIPLTCVPL